MIKKIVSLILIFMGIISIQTTYAYWAKDVSDSNTSSTSQISIGTWLFTGGINYDFEEQDNLSDILADGATIALGSFNNSRSYIRSNYGLMYIPNERASYTLTVNAQILNRSGNGYGILFDSIATNMSSQSDTGYIVQYDRGYANGEIILRPRINGSEQAPVYRYSVNFDNNGNFTTSNGSKNNSNAWWFEEHEFKIVVSIIDHSSMQKSVSIYIDDEFLFSYDYTSTLITNQVADNLVGLRTWSGNVAFYQLDIQ